MLVAAGLLATAAHTAHEAGWIDFGQAQGVEVVVWVAYFVPMALYVPWPSIRRPAPKRVTRPERAPEPAPQT